jgi:transforming growth factor-beta-induced protein
MEMKDIVDTALAAGSFNTLATALQAAGLVETLKGEGPFTVFAPTDEAFAKMDKVLLESLLKPENKDRLTSILTYHVVPGKVTAADVVKLASAKTVQGEEVEIKVDGNTVTLNGVAKVTATDVMAGNGVIHVIDTVILPPSVREALAAADLKDIVDTAVAAGSFNTLATALQAAGLVDTLKGEGPFTVFAPTDEAFAKLDKALLESLLKPENKDKLTAILTYHVVPGKVTAADVAKLTEAETVQGEEITIKTDAGGVMINDAKVITADVATSNGVIHIIDSVIMPPSMATELTALDKIATTGLFETLATAINAAGLSDTLKGEGPFTIFAPTNEAFAKLDKALLESLLKPENKEKLAAILTYHVVPGKVTAADVAKLASAKTAQGEEIEIKVDNDVVTLDGVAKVTVADMPVGNGVIHVIDTVILPPSIRKELGIQTETVKDIVDTAVAAGSFNTLATALQAAGLVDTLKGAGPFTVFAPTDEAFAKLDKALLESLLKPENKDKLIAVLTYHVVPGKVTAADVAKLASAKTVQGEEITVKSDGYGGVMINNARVVTADVVAGNGVIHVIDTVILPPSMK